MIVIKRENWEIIQGTKKPVIECPKCGNFNLGDTAPHGIRENGEVFHSVVCAHDCGFHDFVKLDGWEEGEIKHA